MDSPDQETDYLRERLHHMAVVLETERAPRLADLPPIVGAVWRVHRSEETESPLTYLLEGELLRNTEPRVVGRETLGRDFVSRLVEMWDTADLKIKQEGQLVVPLLAGVLDQHHTVDGQEFGGPLSVEWRWTPPTWPPCNLQALQALTHEVGVGHRIYVELDERLTLRVTNYAALGRTRVDGLVQLVWWKMGSWYAVSANVSANAVALIRPGGRFVYEHLIIQVEAVEKLSVVLSVQTLDEDGDWPE